MSEKNNKSGWFCCLCSLALQFLSTTHCQKCVKVCCFWWLHLTTCVPESGMFHSHCILVLRADMYTGAEVNFNSLKIDLEERELRGETEKNMWQLQDLHAARGFISSRFWSNMSVGAVPGSIHSFGFWCFVWHPYMYLHLANWSVYSWGRKLYSEMHWQLSCLSAEIVLGAGVEKLNPTMGETCGCIPEWFSRFRDKAYWVWGLFVLAFVVFSSWTGAAV